MSWQGIEGHDQVAESFRSCIARGRLANSFLFIGPSGIGKRTFARELARTLLCQTVEPQHLAPCGECSSCRQIDSATHPDLLRVERPKDKRTIPLELLIGPDERRMREGLCHDLSLRPHTADRRVAIIDDADDLGPEGANCLLKTLEEPPPRSVLILIGTSLEKQLPTIRSRCQTIRFGPLTTDMVARLLVTTGMIPDEAQAQRIAEYSEGSLERAAELSDEELWSFRRQLFEQMAQPRLDSPRLAKMIGPFVESAGRDAASRRVRAKQVIQFATQLHRGEMRGLSGVAVSDDVEIQHAVQQSLAARNPTTDTALKCVDRCLVAHRQVERNAHLPTLLDCWLDDLGRLINAAK